MLVSERNLRRAGWPRGADPARLFWLQENVANVANSLYSLIKKIPSSLFRVSSLWFLAALLLLMALELPAASGRVLERIGGDVVAGWLGQLVLLSLLLDALRGTLPRAVALGPVVFYAGYYLAFWQQGVHVARISAELERSNPRSVIAFDPKLHSLVMDQADVFAATHSIPVVYTRDPSYIKDGYLSYRLMETDKIKPYLQANADGVQILSVQWDSSLQRNVRELRSPERPPHQLVTVSVHDDDGEGWSDWNVGFSTTSLSVDGQVIGAFRSGYVRRLPVVPFFTIGCKFLPEPPTRKCRAEFATERVPIESRPGSVDRALYPDPVSIMAGIERRSRSEMVHFRDPAGLPMRAAPGDEDAFKAMQDIVKGRNPTISWDANHFIASNPSRLTPYAMAMTKRFLDLSQSDVADTPNRLGQLRLLESGIANLSSADFATVQDLLAELARKSNAIRDGYPLLYLRLSDAGSKMYSIYRDQFLAQDATDRERLLAVVALCRIGQADSELVSAIDSEWEKFGEGELKDVNYRTALFAALLKLGREDTLRSSGQPKSRILKEWYEAVLAGKGKTDLGPNNCMPMEWPEGAHVAGRLGPGLTWSNEHWVPSE